GDPVGWRVRRALRLTGRGVRQERGALFDPKAIRNCTRIADCPGDARWRSRSAWLAGLRIWVAVAGVDGSCSGGRAAGVRALAGEGQRPEQAERCVFYRERLY